ncbi:Rossmann-fold NAD(P)-binding domain-containing protein [Sphingobacterium wenxiniae]|uniref:Nucleoside-diphosphate-sugar epimerase n=1 Tax=Sphingobacterium wenxiniae TaxID=683125 RepID=A0A1I6T055_9SPHI|nr:hypothetical protein [Sphingobacterium wenxiniae]SFS82468.1 hypothetical protein SAMN05660206_105175 [Sphingobacterium wenxiniae]
MNVVISGLNNYAGLRSVGLMEDENFRVFAIVRSLALLQKRLFEPINAEFLEMDLLQYGSVSGPGWPDIQAAYYFTQVPTLSDPVGMKVELLCLGNFIQFIRSFGCNRLVYVVRLMDKIFIEPIVMLLKESGVKYTVVLKHSVIGRDSLIDRVVKKVCNHRFFPYSNGSIKRFFQPLGVRDFINWLKRLLEVEVFQGRILEVGGAEALSFQELSQLYRRLGMVREDTRFFRLPGQMTDFFYSRRLGMDKSDFEEMNNMVAIDDITENVWSADMPFVFGSVEDVLRSDYNL